MRTQPGGPAMPTFCGCFTVRSGTVGLAVYSLVFSLIFLAWRVVETAYGKAQLPEVLLGFLLGLLVLVISLAALVGVAKGREGLLIPFLVFHALDLVMSVLTIFGCLLQLSSYMKFLLPARTHPYLLAESEFSKKASVSSFICLALAITALLLIKVYLLRCVWSCYKHIRACRQFQQQQQPDQEKGLFFVLPTYEEALKLPLKEDLAPPPYSGV
ncbi:lysosomal-associated transmembrane protein 5 [Microcaecilia unicolor]|uniref:Lysosomal-associated transmembrane protein 5-like n=1 Tax=Microcaecilia unicolor TaxID=1415580 RepID=A0A6P7ZFV8_9AMPH|nr:lysosomal-associated transmembrane protein 5-like [Microcaecilia unicolor]